ncbi:50S ribosomal protein L11 methyltransferase [Flavobacteriaceae bacterium]|nr:50S ribosomal protein L11 methyltransferase [Flavobacteriaceae bacterium]
MDTDSTYIAYYFEVEPLSPGVEILIAELGFAGFESFVETPKGVTAYIQKKEHLPTMLENIFILQNTSFSIQYSFEEIEQVNWNAKWEENFHPILVDDRCAVRAPFHEKSSAAYDIVIEPKMSFGTGHHETTHMMIQFILDTDFNDKTVLDMGCGTGVLAILAEMKGATTVEAIDIDQWCFLNSIENVERNSCQHIKVSKGDARILKSKKFDIIIANINRNILIQDIPTYATCLNANGLLFLSGFYNNDIPMIQEVCADYNLSLESQISRNDWVALKFKIN